MATSFSGRVLPWSARFQIGMAIVMAATCMLLFFAGLASRGVRSDPDLRPVLWTLLAASGGFVALWIALVAILTRTLVVDERGVRIGGRSPIDLGRPIEVSHGRYDEPTRRGTSPQIWIALEGADRVVVIRRTGRQPEWPEGKPPAKAEAFDGSTLDLEALRSAARSA